MTHKGQSAIDAAFFAVSLPENEASAPSDFARIIICSCQEHSGEVLAMLLRMLSSCQTYLLQLLLLPALELLPEVVPALLVPPLLVLVIAGRALPVLLGLVALSVCILSQICPGARVLQAHLLRRQAQRQRAQRSMFARQACL